MLLKVHKQYLTNMKVMVYELEDVLRTHLHTYTVISPMCERDSLFKELELIGYTVDLYIEIKLEFVMLLIMILHSSKCNLCVIEF